MSGERLETGQGPAGAARRLRQRERQVQSAGDRLCRRRSKADGVAARRARNASGDKAAILATVGPSVDGGVVLSGHTDVVPVESQALSGDPFELRQRSGRLYRRGACDMKGFDACVLAMVPAFQAAALKRPIHIVLSYDEETTCLGSLDVIAWFGHDEPRPGAIVVGEPTMMQVADAHKSIATLTAPGSPATRRIRPCRRWGRTRSRRRPTSSARSGAWRASTRRARSIRGSRRPTRPCMSA